jgi:hypothetical protein
MPLQFSGRVTETFWVVVPMVTVVIPGRRPAQPLVRLLVGRTRETVRARAGRLRGGLPAALGDQLARHVQPADRRAPLPVPPNGRDASLPRLSQAGHHDARYRPLTMGCRGRPGTACSTVKYARATAVPAFSSTSMAIDDQRVREPAGEQQRVPSGHDRVGAAGHVDGRDRKLVPEQVGVLRHGAGESADHHGEPEPAARREAVAQGREEPGQGGALRTDAASGAIWRCRIAAEPWYPCRQTMRRPGMGVISRRPREADRS